jgi:hypothetical protein
MNIACAVYSAGRKRRAENGEKEINSNQEEHTANAEHLAMLRYKNDPEIPRVWIV